MLRSEGGERNTHLPESPRRQDCRSNLAMGSLHSGAAITISGVAKRVRGFYAAGLAVASEIIDDQQEIIDFAKVA